MKARSAECECTTRFTCGHCLRNAKPYFFTLSDGSAIVVGPLQGVPKQQTEVEDANTTR